ncbi:hypothetical protein [Streptomyces sp. NPDC057877]|uniref:hypothetical protein n=1 Tax=Streptomyces sp. NPDC057877 TaxID=3346269 RepID=UPI0036C2603A
MPYPIPRPPAPNGPGTCPRCHAPVIWCTTAKQNTQMVDRDRNPGGNQAVRQDRTGRWLTRQLDNDRPIPEADEHLHMPHAATCTATRQQAAARRRTPHRARTGVRPVRWQQP